MADVPKSLIITDGLEVHLPLRPQRYHHLHLEPDADVRSKFAEVQRALEERYSKVIYISTGEILEPDLQQYEVVFVRDHICLWDSLEFTPMKKGQVRFLDISEPYDKGLLEKAERQAILRKIKTGQVVAFSHPAPHLLTPSEKRIIRDSGADAVLSFLPLLAKLVRSMDHPLLAMLPLSIERDEFIGSLCEEMA